MYYNYVVLKHACRVEFFIDRGKGSDQENKQLFGRLAAHRKAIETAFGAPLSWEQAEGMRACYIRYTSNLGGWRSPESEWPKIQDNAIDDMIRFAAALQPYIDKLKEAA
jgi:uncharacterized protein DUF4268